VFRDDKYLMFINLRFLKYPHSNLPRGGRSTKIFSPLREIRKGVINKGKMNL
jgi:hypothetical protein